MITVFGSVNLDLISCVERLPRPGETVGGRGFRTAPGGKGANQALAARRAGAGVRLIGVVGRDDFAGAALALLQAGGVDLAGLREVDGPTGVALILIDAAGENVIAVIPGVNGALSEADAEDLEFGPGDILLLQLEVPVPAMAAAARRAREQGAKVLLNFARFHEAAMTLLGGATHVIVNELECELIVAELGLTASRAEEQAAALAGHLGIAVIATLGKSGAIAVDGDGARSVPALPVHAIDTVGAGDTFCGYLAAGLAEGLGLEPALRFATAAGSLACTKAGAQPAIPLRREVDEVLGRLSR